MRISHSFKLDCCDDPEESTIHCSICKPGAHCPFPQLVVTDTANHAHEHRDGGCINCGHRV